MGGAYGRWLGREHVDHMVAVNDTPVAVAVSPPYWPTGTAAPESASSVVTRPLPVCVPAARTVTPAGGESAVVVESL